MPLFVVRSAFCLLVMCVSAIPALAADDASAPAEVRIMRLPSGGITPQVMTETDGNTLPRLDNKP